MIDMSRKCLLVFLVITFGILVVFGYVQPAPTTPTKPLKIGVIGPLVGPLGENGKNVARGIELAVAEFNSEVGGRKVELIVEDDGGDTAVGVSKGKKLVTSDGVEFMMVFLTAVNLGLRDFLIDNNIVYMGTMGESKAMYHAKYTKNCFVTSYVGPEVLARMQAWIAIQKGYRKAALFALELASGHDMANEFKSVFEASGGKVVLETFTPVGNLDFASHLARVNVKNTDVVWTFSFGGDGIRLIKQYADYGLKGRIPILAHGAQTAASILPSIGDTAIGVESAYSYSETLNTPEMQRFAKAYNTKFGKHPVMENDSGYVAGKAAMLALKAVNGNTKDIDKLIGALEKVKFEAPRGPFRFGPQHSPAHNIYHLRVDKIGNKLQNTVLQTFRDIELGWMPPR